MCLSAGWPTAPLLSQLLECSLQLMLHMQNVHRIQNRSNVHTPSGKYRLLEKMPHIQKHLCLYPKSGFLGPGLCVLFQVKMECVKCWVLKIWSEQACYKPGQLKKDVSFFRIWGLQFLCFLMIHSKACPKNYKEGLLFSVLSYWISSTPCVSY